MSDSLSERLGSVITKDLLDALDALYPLRLPDPSATDREIWMAVGARQLVEVLHTKYAEANDSLLSHS